MDPVSLIKALRGRGFHLRVEDGLLYIRPQADLTDEDKQNIRAHRDVMVLILSGLSDAQVEAIAERAYWDPPDFSESNVVLRESCLIELFDGKWWAVDPALIRQLDELAAFARQQREQQHKSSKRKKGKG